MTLLIDLNRNNTLEIDLFNEEEERRFEKDFESLQSPIGQMPLSMEDLEIIKTSSLVDRFEIEKIWAEHKEHYKIAAQAHKRHTGKIYGSGFRMRRLSSSECGWMDAHRVIVGLVFGEDYMPEQFSIETGLINGWPDVPSNREERKFTTMYTEQYSEPSMNYHVLKHVKLTPIFLLPGHWFGIKDYYPNFTPLGVIFK